MLEKLLSYLIELIRVFKKFIIILKNAQMKMYEINKAITREQKQIDHN